MKLFLTYSILVLLTVLSVKSNAGTNGALRPNSWETFEKNLLGVIPEVLSGTNSPTDYIFRLPEMQAIRDKGTISLWMEMADQGDFPLVATAGFLCVKTRRPERAFEAALSVLASSSMDISNVSARFDFVLPAIEYSSAAQPSTNNLEVFTRFAQRTDLTKGEALFIADHIRYQDLNLRPRRITIIERAIKRQAK